MVDISSFKGSIHLLNDNEKGDFMKRLKLLLLAAVFMSDSLYAVEAGQLSTIQAGDDTFSGLLSEPAEVAKVRLPIQMTSYEAILIRNEKGTQKIEHKAMAPLHYNLRATINRTNHFYVSDWHIETVPTKWDKDQKNWDTQVKFYKRYGQEQELEEFVGTLAVSGKLLNHDKGRVFMLQAKAREQFNNKAGNPLLAVEVGQFEIATRGKMAKSNK